MHAWMVKCATSGKSTCFAAMLQNKLHVSYVARFTPLIYRVTVALACSRLQDNGEKSFSHLPIPKSRASCFRFARCKYVPTRLSESLAQATVAVYRVKNALKGHPRCDIIYSLSLFYGLWSGLGSLLRIFCFLCFTSTVSNKLSYTGDEPHSRLPAPSAPYNTYNIYSADLLGTL